MRSIKAQDGINYQGAATDSNYDGSKSINFLKQYSVGTPMEQLFLNSSLQLISLVNKRSYRSRKFYFRGF